MTAPTPEKMRDLANKLPMPEAWERPFLNGSLSLNEQIAAALRAAADQLEAVDVVTRDRSSVPTATVRAILTADTAPQHPCDRDGHDDYCGACATCGRATPPSIADMAPGERVCNNSAGHSTHTWFPAPFDSAFGDVRYICPGRIEPSSTRDAMPPASNAEVSE